MGFMFYMYRNCKAAKGNAADTILLLY